MRNNHEKILAIDMAVAMAFLLALGLFAFVGWPKIQDHWQIGMVSNQKGWFYGSNQTEKDTSTWYLIPLAGPSPFVSQLPQSKMEIGRDPEPLLKTHSPETINTLKVSSFEFSTAQPKGISRGILRNRVKYDFVESWDSTLCTLPSPETIKAEEDPHFCTFKIEDLNVFELDRLPQAVNLQEISQQIPYPRKFRDAGIGGKVIFEVFLDAKGKRISHRVKKSPNPDLAAFAEKQLKKLVFLPAISAGNPVPCRIFVPFEFRLDYGIRKRP